MHSQDQLDDAYYGKILLIHNESSSKKQDETKPKVVYQFGMCSLADKKSYLQNGDIVTFQTGEKKFAQQVTCVQSSQPEQQNRSRNSNTTTPTNNGPNLAGNEYKKGKVDSVKGHCGHIEYFNGVETKKLFFHVSDVLSNEMAPNSGGADYIPALKPGDDVEFMVSHNPRNNKYSATRIKRVGGGVKVDSAASQGDTSAANEVENKRPERLVTKLKLANIDKSGKQLVLTRQPNNPDGKLKSFCRQLRERMPGSLTPLLHTESQASTTEACESTAVAVHTDNNVNANTTTNNTNSATSQLSIMDLLMGVQ